MEHGVLSKVENANGVVTLLKELRGDNDVPVAVAAVHCLRRLFSQLLDPSKNPQVGWQALSYKHYHMIHLVTAQFCVYLLNGIGVVCS